ncbi:MAG TPA: deoxyribodipyrimidine photo-lyase [Alphaproteobacteria bacterium]|nr:deoxyribodipyrimidine photo-lyase [Alphaproteobacteria bacterium]
MTDKFPIILWLRQNLRLSDNAALTWAAGRGPVIPLYILDESGDPWAPGGASKWWLNETLADLAESFKKLGAPLILRRGKPEKILRELAKETDAKTITWQRIYEPFHCKQDGKLANDLEEAGFEIQIHPGFLLFEPEPIKTGGGTPFKVYTPFSKACFAAPAPGKTLPAPKKLESISGIKSDNLKDWKLVPRSAVWPKGLADAWTPGEAAAHDRLKDFLSEILAHYKTGRDRPDKDYTSRLSPYLHFGNISPRQVWHAVQFALAKTPSLGNNAERYLLELLWREFSWHLLFHIPDLPTEPLNKSFAKFPWKHDVKSLKAWQQGMTGYPIVDAGMRQLWHTGWMHNRVRMIVASFLIKDLLIDWREGAAWFWDTLVDADLGNNTASWQWVAGCGADASPYFRIFNPTLQGEKFDPNGDYVREWVPELARLDAAIIHSPWKAPTANLAKAGVVLGKTYPHPIVDHGKARERALEALKQTKSAAPQATETNDLFD